jgi:hypothetical protein
LGCKDYTSGILEAFILKKLLTNLMVVSNFSLVERGKLRSRPAPIRSDKQGYIGLGGWIQG